MSDLMTFPETVEEFMEQYKVVDTEKIYTNGIELVPIFRMKQWFEHLPTALHEMTAREFLQIHARFVEWCTNQPCSRCNYRHGSCLMSLAETPEQRVADMQKWAREHPEVNDER